MSIDAAVMASGKSQYMMCMACHGMNGEGAPNIGPPLANSEWVTGPVENLIRIQLRGLTGPIEVAGTEYNFAAPMMAMGAAQSDENVATVLTYIRNSFGNEASAVTPAEVAALRSEVGKPLLTVADLLPPKPETTTATTGTIPGGQLPSLPSLDARSSLGASTWGIATTAIIGILSLVAVIRMKAANKS